MDNIDFSDYEDIIKTNFYSDDFAHMLNLSEPDANGNTSQYREFSTSDDYFDTPSDLDTGDFF